jgi:hypothetical protein
VNLTKVLCALTRCRSVCDPPSPTTSTTAGASTKEHSDSCIGRTSGQQKWRYDPGVGIFRRPSTHSWNNTYIRIRTGFPPSFLIPSDLFFPFQQRLLTSRFSATKKAHEQIVKQIGIQICTYPTVFPLQHARAAPVKPARPGGRPWKIRTMETSTNPVAAPPQATSPFSAGTPSMDIVGAPTTTSLPASFPSSDYLLPMEALTNLDWGCEVLPTKPRGRPKKTSNSPVQERDDWTLQDDVDLPIGLGNDDIFNYEEENFNGSDDCYLSAEEDTGDEYGWEEDTLHEKKHNNWPPEMLHAPSSLRKRRYKRKAPIWPLLDDLTYVSLADGEEGDHSHQEQHRPPLLQGHCSNNDDALILQLRGKTPQGTRKAAEERGRAP